MTYQLRKQITIAFIFFFILALIGTGFYYLVRPKATCFDGVKNQDEKEIDCGGVCISCEVLTLQPIEIIWAKAIPAGDGEYDLAAKVRNPNPNFGTGNFNYEFQVKDKTGKQFGLRAGKSFILPGDSRHIIETNFKSSEIPASVQLVVQAVEKEEWKTLKSDKSLRLFVKDKQFSVLNPEPGYLAEASGVVQNSADFDFEKVYVNVLLFDAENRLAGVSKTEIDTLLAGESRHFSMRWFHSLDESINYMEAEAQTNLFLDANYIRKYGAPGSETTY